MTCIEVENGPPDIFGNRDRTIQAGIGQQHSEFLAADATWQITGAMNLIANAPCDLDKKLIACRMTEVVIVSLEVVGIDDQQREV